MAARSRYTAYAKAVVGINDLKEAKAFCPRASVLEALKNKKAASQKKRKGE